MLRLRIPLLPLSLLGIALASCGGSSPRGGASKSPAELVAASLRAADGARSVLVSGLLTSSSPRIRLDMHIVPGGGAQGLVYDGPYTVEMVLVGSRLYLKGNAAFYQHFVGNGDEKLLRGRWLRVSAGASRFHPLTAFAELHVLLSTALGQHESLSKGRATYVAGQKVIELQDKAHGGAVDIATTGAPYPMQVLRSGDISSEGIVFDQWNHPYALKAPSNAVGIETLSGRN